MKDLMTTIIEMTYIMADRDESIDAIMEDGLSKELAGRFYDMEQDVFALMCISDTESSMAEAFSGDILAYERDADKKYPVFSDYIEEELRTYHKHRSNIFCRMHIGDQFLALHNTMPYSGSEGMVNFSDQMRIFVMRDGSVLIHSKDSVAATTLDRVLMNRVETMKAISDTPSLLIDNDFHGGTKH